MMRTQLTLVAASLATLMMTTAHAVPPPAEADLSISARVVPSAEVCTLDLSDNGTADYGDIQAGTLSATSATALRKKKINYIISCTSPTKVSLTLMDNRAGTATADINNDPQASFGLGQHNGVNIGSNNYRISMTNMLVNNATGAPLWTRDGGTSWVGVGSSPMRHTPGNAYSFEYYPSSGDTPEAITQVTGELETVPNIAPTSSFDMTQVINLDGFATMTLNYI